MQIIAKILNRIGAAFTPSSWATTGLPAGLDAVNARGAKQFGALGTPGSPAGDPSRAMLGAPGSAGGGSSQAELVRRSNFWRDNYNPLRGLTIARCMALFEQAERGAFPEIQLTLRKAEKRFPVLKGFIEKLLSHLEALDGKVRVKEQLPAGATPEMAEKQRKFLQGRYDLLRNFKTSIAQIALADVRGYAVLQKHRHLDGVNDGAVEELYWLEPWCWASDGFYGDFYYNENSQFGIGLGSCQATLGENNRIGSDAMPRADFVIRESESPLYEIALIALVNWLMGRRDYASFVETFGLPNAFVILPPDIAPGKEAEYQAVAEKVASGANGALPPGAEVKFPNATVRNNSPYRDFCDTHEKDVVLAGTGGHLTMLEPEHGGLGKGGAAEHDAAWQRIAITKAVRINDTLQRDFDAPELAAEFPGEPVCVYFALGIKDNEDVGELLDNVVKCEGVNLQCDAKEISERSGLKLTRIKMAAPGEGTAPGGGTGPTGNDPLAGLAQKDALKVSKGEINAAMRNRLVKILDGAASATGPDGSGRGGVSSGADETTCEAHVLPALQAELQPLRDRLEAVSKISDPAIRAAKLQAVQDEMDTIVRDVTADPSELANALAQLNANALKEGLTAKTK